MQLLVLVLQRGDVGEEVRNISELQEEDETT